LTCADLELHSHLLPLVCGQGVIDVGKCPLNCSDNSVHGYQLSRNSCHETVGAGFSTNREVFSGNA